MKSIGRVLKYMLLSFLLLLILFVGGVALFMNLSPQFGNKPTAEEISRYQELDHYSEDHFMNLIPTSMDLGFRSGWDVMKQQMKGTPHGEPDFDIPVQKVQNTFFSGDQTKLIWFGHSAFALQIDGKTLLLDPMLGEVPAPVSFMGPKRFGDLPMAIEDIPHVDAILISHDHYDHLDYGSIMQLSAKTDHFFVPLGVGAHFRSWGIDEDRITEMDWWEETTFNNLQFAFTPSRHFSGRGFTRNETLWGSWVIKGQDENIYFSGDGGYGPHFKAIGKKYGPFDLALLECGQYNKYWAQIHMMPEETVQAAIDVQADLMMPIHWGAFKLSLHSWTDPIERVTLEANKQQVPWVAPKIGQLLSLDSAAFEQEIWWVK